MFNKKYATLLALVMELVTLELVLIFAGSYVDRRMGWQGIGVILGATLGLAVWIFHLVIALKTLTDDS
jgi:hypothetical protein